MSLLGNALFTLFIEWQGDKSAQPCQIRYKRNYELNLDVIKEICFVGNNTARSNVPFHEKLQYLGVKVFNH